MNSKKIFGTGFSEICVLQMFTGGLGGTHRFSLQYLWKTAVRITEKPYTSHKEILCMLWRNPVIFTDWGEILVISGFSPQSVNITGFPHNIHNLSLWGFLCDSYSPLSISKDELHIVWFINNQLCSSLYDWWTTPT